MTGTTVMFAVGAAWGHPVSKTKATPVPQAFAVPTQVTQVRAPTRHGTLPATIDWIDRSAGSTVTVLSFCATARIMCPANPLPAIPTASSSSIVQIVAVALMSEVSRSPLQFSSSFYFFL